MLFFFFCSSFSYNIIMDYPLRFGIDRVLVGKQWVTCNILIFTKNKRNFVFLIKKRGSHVYMYIYMFNCSLNNSHLIFRFIQHDTNARARIGVMPRFGDAKSTSWFDVKNHCSYHLINSFEEGHEVIQSHKFLIF